MSDDKKTSWGKAHDTAAEAAKANPSDRQRARNQDVLPDILGKQLRAAYGELLSSPVPDAISDLIKKLETAQPGKKPQTPDAGDGEDSQ
jgi:hypothetical protein